MFKKIIKLFLSVLVMVPLFSVNVFAKDNSLSINAFVYEFDSKSSYEISETASNNDLDSFGTLNITGKVKSSSETDNSEIIVNDGQTTISYFSSSKKLAWYYVKKKDS